ncbi:MAG: choice-of-anchor J domain-containing protein, partial [Bacteroidota bacterium]
MKKNLLFLFACAFSVMANGQSSETKMTGTKTKAVTTGANRSLVNHTNAKGPGVPSNASIIYSQDFAGGIPATWTITDNAGLGEVFTWTTTGSQTTPDSLLSAGTTAANGYVIFDSDNGSTNGPEDCDMVTDAINCSGHSTVFLSLNEYFVQYAASTATVSVSTDGVNFTDFYSAETGLTQNQTSGNPHYAQVDISSVAANQATVYVRFKWTGDYDWWWMFDDVTIFEPAATDAGVTASSLSSGCSLASNTPVTITIKNFGGSSISNIPVSFTVNGGTAVNEVAPGPIAPNSNYDYTFTATANLSTGVSSTVLCTTALAGDANTGNDSYSVTVDNFTPVNLSSAYVMDFEPADDLSAWGVYDGNGDGVTWAPVTTLVYSGTQALRKAGSGSADDDWLWSGCFNMTAGTTYQLDYWYRQFDLTAPCDLEVFL